VDESDTSATGRHALRRWWDAQSGPNRGYGLLLVFIIAMFVMSAFEGRVGSVVTSSLGLIIVLVAYFASPIGIKRSRFIVLAVIAGAAPVVTALTDPDQTGRALPYFAQVFILGVVVIAMMVRVLRRPVVDIQTIYGAVAIYLLIGLAFAWAYVGLNVWDEAQLSIDSTEEAEFFEFSFVVMTTLGFGNEVPTAPLSGRIVVLEAILGQVFLATFLARIVSMYGQRRDDPAGDPGV
jgi:hypothetical protein